MSMLLLAVSPRVAQVEQTDSFRMNPVHLLQRAEVVMVASVQSVQTAAAPSAPGTET
jgi:hypothetical protein